MQLEWSMSLRKESNLNQAVRGRSEGGSVAVRVGRDDLLPVRPGPN